MPGPGGMIRLLALILCLSVPGWIVPLPAHAEDGHQLWLRYQPLEIARREILRRQLTSITAPDTPSPIVRNAVMELQRGLQGLLAAEIPVSEEPGDHSVLIGTPATSGTIRQLALPLDSLGKEGFLLRLIDVAGHDVVVIAAAHDAGVLYGVFELLRLIESGRDLESLDISEQPRIDLRLLNHWDNLDRSVERGYAGQSLWDWWRLPNIVDTRYREYARANASIGINGTVLNNVNAVPEVLTQRYLLKVAALADEFREWGLRVYLAVRFSAPVDVGGLATADPLDPEVREWWQARTAEIYRLVPDFGGFLVKANSEGQPGPQNYGRSHADGANMLAAALEPHGGVVMWRAFVYDQDNPDDRVKQAFSEFKPLDGQFADNVLVQVKNGPLDFQPREPFHPLFGAMPRTPLVMEFQITQEYLGFATHLVYLGELWEEVLSTDTHVKGAGSTVASVIDGSLHGQSRTGIAGVANIGTDRNWSGSIFGQANWFAFGRLAWNPQLGAADIAAEWLKMTFSHEPAFITGALGIMMRSRQAAVDYMTPLGLAHLMGTGHHYGPAPWVDNLSRPDWNPFYYHRADRDGIGINRTANGSNAVSQYAPAVEALFSDRATIPDQYLLWFHRVDWDERLGNGNTLWEELVARYERGVASVQRMQREWKTLESFIDAERFDAISRKLAVQLEEAIWWRNACLAYFAERAGRALPAGVAPPPESLDHYQSLEFPYAPGNG